MRIEFQCRFNDLIIGEANLESNECGIVLNDSAFWTHMWIVEVTFVVFNQTYCCMETF